MAIDPYRTLGLEPGASQAEIKRAYRRLAKAFHPDSAGESALPRFLAIHEAYDRLTTGRRSARGPTTTASGGAAGGDPWRADPARARAAREQARTRRARPSGMGGDATGPAGSSAGQRSAGTGSSGRPGSASRSRGGGRPSSGTGEATQGAAGGRPAGGRRRPTRKATLGSTSYDEAREATDSAWGGAAWYGPTSGEYWTVNPREYADPRKHGPEYQSRARRGASGASEGWADEPATSAGTGSSATTEGPAGPAGRVPPQDSGRRRAWATPPSAPYDSGAGESEAPRPATPSPLRTVLEADSSDPVRRLGLALLAWAPLGVAIAAIIGQMTGCATYSVSCGPTAPFIPWLAQAAILGILLLAPPLSRVLVVGTVAILIALLPVAGLFVGFGGAGDPAAAVPLIVLLTIAWLVGIAVAIAAQRRPRRPANRP